MQILKKRVNDKIELEFYFEELTAPYLFNPEATDTYYDVEDILNSYNVTHAPRSVLVDYHKQFEGSPGIFFRVPRHLNYYRVNVYSVNGSNFIIEDTINDSNNINIGPQLLEYLQDYFNAPDEDIKSTDTRKMFIFIDEFDPEVVAMAKYPKRFCKRLNIQDDSSEEKKKEVYTPNTLMLLKVYNRGNRHYYSNILEKLSVYAIPPYNIEILQFVMDLDIPNYAGKIGDKQVDTYVSLVKSINRDYVDDDIVFDSGSSSLEEEIKLYDKDATIESLSLDRNLLYRQLSHHRQDALAEFVKITIN